MKSKKTKLWGSLVIVGLILFTIGMAGFVIDAMTIMNVTLAWVMVGVIVTGCTTFMCGLVLFLVYNKEMLKNYLKKF